MPHPPPLRRRLAPCTCRPGAPLKEYVAPRHADVPAWYWVKVDGRWEAVVVWPYTAEVVRTLDKENTLFAWAEMIHGTRVYMARPRARSGWRRVRVPDLTARGAPGGRCRWAWPANC